MLKNNSYAGKYISGYSISLELASSTSSRVFLGESISPDRHNAAIKQIYAVSILSREDKENFLQEVNTLKQLRHPYILPILSASILKGTPYIISEYAPNGSLHDRLQHGAPEPMAQNEAISILSQVGQALYYAHQANRIHGNLKPQNILFSSKGNALLADFKFASLSSPDNFSATPPHGLAYMSAEQLEGVNTKENDQYSLGSIAYEMFTGRKPFTTPSVKQPGTLYKTRTLIAPTKLNPALPRRIEQAILKAMAKEPSQRYKSVMEFIKALGIPGTLIVPDDAQEESKQSAIPVQKNVGPLFPGLKAATTGATTLIQFTAKNTFLRNTFPSLAHFSTLPLVNGSLVVPFTSPKKRKKLWPFLLIASLVLIAMVVAGMAFAFSPSRTQQGNKGSTGTGSAITSQTAQSGKTAIPARATPAPTKSTNRITIPAQPTRQVQPPQPKPTKQPPPPAPTLQPTATTAPKTTLSVAPAVLNATNCTHSNNSYTCAVTLSLGAAAGTGQNWYTYSIGVGTSFNPSNGTIAPGQAVHIQLTVFDNCTKMGTFVFVGSKTNVTAIWKC
ncbi:MAG: serine/threonine protein kinase [Ktedonobacteraceae bacterium]|nr:serine/threonine protein kinase [Ktedonobacteraceae bacterium]